MKKIQLIIVSVFFIIGLVGCSNNSKAQKTDDPATQIEQTSTDNEPATTPATQTTSNVQTIENSNGDPWSKINPTKVNVINTQQFKELIFDYTKSQTWQYKADKPCVIDFYADWCRPCRMVAPIMEELAKEYNGEVYFYKLNVDYNREVAQVFGIRSIPSVLFCPVNGQPRMAVGAMQKEAYVQAIKEILGVELPQK